ncbi:hypothetical protein EPA93_43035 [Ktedonosporobacter rubrisoli]|uniref:Uncharacterized protein n=1 Tax=Ktedonosporobacter rubrisoli TaxID=2509675 RepID=A0A4V0Z090_KTERU|nr:hypothetical protein [Ktedonosporobacter rubrisoli]QBD82391.1 hypothetical protein EPA93_43035 [Ktedonosporobacter rubrisoli]
MGVERAVTRWYVQRQSILNEIAQLEAKLAPAVAESENGGDAPESEKTALLEQLAVAQKKLHALGHCPKPMMG